MASAVWLLLLLAPCLAWASIEPFGLADVRLADTSIQSRYENVNSKYLLDMLDPDRLLWVFRQNAQLPTPGEPYVGSWEDPGCELRGHFVGHYLTALSLAKASTDNARFKERLELMVKELKVVQEKLGGGYLSAFPTAHFDRLDRLEYVWAPYYVIHKIIAGLLDAYELAGIADGLAMATKMADYFLERSDRIIAAKGKDHWPKVLEVEFGGMNEAMFRLYRLTNNSDHRRFAEMFNKPMFYEAMRDGQDVLAGLHANTHLAQIVGFAEAFDTTGDKAARKAVEEFFGMLTLHHSFATGGSNDHEFWQAPDELADSIWLAKDSMDTQETCTQYNILKIARALFRWTGESRFADFYERALQNGIMGVARLPPEDWPQAPHQHGLHEGDESEPHADHHHHHHHLSHSLTLAASAGANSAVATERRLAAADLPRTLKHRRQHSDVYLKWWAFDKPQPSWNASDAPGPGVFLYLLPLGSGNSKSDNTHHWGFPFHSFWCCYGTAIEAFAKLGDSIYFKDMKPAGSGSERQRDQPAFGGGGTQLRPRLYINQYVSSTLQWRDMGLEVSMAADMYAPGPSANSSITIAPLAAAAAGTVGPFSFSMMLRLPSWSNPSPLTILINGQAYTDCPGLPTAGSYCEVARSWSPGDKLLVRLPMRWWVKPLPETRAQFRGLQAIMLGPFMMAGLSHGDQHLALLPGAGGKHRDRRGIGSDSEAGLDGLPPGVAAYPPEEADELLSIKAAWNETLHLRHDKYHIYTSAVEDGGDAMDATFRLGRSCHHASGTAQAAEPVPAGGGSDGDRARHAAMGRGTHDLHAAHMRMGQHDGGHHVTLEAMNYPNHFIAADDFDIIILQPGAPAGSQTSSSTSVLSSTSSTSSGSGIDPLAGGLSGGSALQQQQTGSAAASGGCHRAAWLLRPGLDGQPGTVSFEAMHKPGYFLTVQTINSVAGGGGSGDKGGCKDVAGEECGVPGGPICSSGGFTANVRCRSTCNTCGPVKAALRLRPKALGDTIFAALSSFTMEPPARRAYPAGSHVLAAANRHWLLAPIGNLIDERYTAYFVVKEERQQQ